MAATFDTTFGTTAPGYTITKFSTLGNYAEGFYQSQVIDSNNNIYVTGYIKNTIENLVLAKYTNTGALDKTFGAGKGYIIGDYYNGQESRGTSLVLDSTGNVIVTGYAYDNDGAKRLLLAKYKSNGELDKSFGGGKGWLTNDFGYSSNEYGSTGGSLALDSSGNIVVTGQLIDLWGESKPILLVLARYKPNGDLDKSFGGNGTGWANTNDDIINQTGPFSLVINKKTGDIIIYGSNYTIDDSNPNIIVKFTANGILDTNFGDKKGYIITQGSNYSISQTGSVQLDTAGRILITGTGGTFEGFGTILVRYMNNGDLDTSFGENKGYTIIYIPKKNYYVGISLVQDSIGNILVLAVPSKRDKPLIVRYTSDGITDPTFGDNGIATIDIFSSIFTQISLDNNGKLLVCGAAGNSKNIKDFGLAVCRFLNNTVEPICLVAGTPILTDQGLLPIELIQPKKHTISNKAIVAITKTVTPEKVLVCFEANSLGINCPSQRTIMTSGHEVLYKGQLVQAKHFLGRVDGVHTVPYNDKDILYNVLQEQHGLMRVNNMVLETLHPENKVAKQILGNLN